LRRKAGGRQRGGEGRVDRSVRVRGVLSILVGAASAIDIGTVLPDRAVAVAGVNHWTTGEVCHVSMVELGVVVRGRGTASSDGSGGVDHGAVRVEDGDGVGARALLEGLLAATTLVLVVGELLLESPHKALRKLVPWGLLVRRHGVPLLTKQLGEVSGAEVRVVERQLRTADTHVDEIDWTMSQRSRTLLGFRGRKDLLFIGRRGV
jgi:hypothetical protein